MMRRILGIRPGFGWTKSHTNPTPAQQQRRQLRFLWLTVIALALTLWAILVVRSPSTSEFQVDRVSPTSVTAHRDYEFESVLRTEAARLRAESDPSTIVATVNSDIPIRQRADLNNLLQTITQIRNDETLSLAEELERLTDLPNSTLVILPELAQQIVNLNDEEWNQVRQRSLDLYDRSMRERNYELSEQAIADLRERVLPYWSSALLPEGEQREMALLFSTSFLRPNRTIDEEATRQRKEIARAEISPEIVTIQRGEVIVREGEIVTRDIAEKLEVVGELRRDDDWRSISGMGLLSVLSAVLFGLYIQVTQHGVWTNKRALLLIAGMFALNVLLARLLFGLQLGPAWPYVFPLAATVLLLSALFNTSLALVSAALLSLLIGFIGDRQFGLSAALFLGSLAAIFAVGRSDRSLNFLLAGLAVATVVILTQVGLWFMAYPEPSVADLIEIVIFGGLNGLLSAMLALGLYNLTGHMAGIITPFQLMELAHPSQPLLRKLIREAPGTYYHSLSVGNLAESAAEAIGADALLLRVAAYYHDIGKSIRPYFFTDNQSDRENVHNELDPRTSAQIIAEHVKEGVNMARAAGLPRQLIDFIPTHHGTSTITHFYQIALQQEDTVNIEDFRYPGPKPQTREQAILMLADSVEATVRSKSQHGKLAASRHGSANGSSNGHSGKQTLEELVKSIIDDRIRSGQLDESPLTLQDIARIRQAFINTLQGIYHPRTDYAPQVVKTGV